MTNYYYKALTESGKTVEGHSDAGNEDAILNELAGKGYYPVEVKISDDIRKSPAEKKTGVLQSKKITGKDITTLTSQFASLISSGFTIQRTLNALADNVEKPALSELLHSIEEAVKGGDTLSTALENYPHYFSTLYVNMVRAGEAAGVLDKIFLRLAEMRVNDQKIVSRIKGALIYPAIMIFVMTVAVIVLLTFVLPKFMTMFEDLGGALPLPTLIIMRLSSICHNYWYVGLIVMALIVFFYKQYSSTEEGAYRIDRFKLNIPVIGNLLKKVAVIRFSRTLGTLLVSGVSLITALDLVQNIMNNKILSEAVGKVKEDVTEGSKLADALTSCGIFPSLLVQMVSLGEEAGTIDEMLINIANNYDEEVENLVSAFTSMLEPLIIMVMGVVVGFIVMAMLLPIFDIDTMIK